MSHKKVSLSALRWSEDRMREEIYKEHLKQRATSSNGASLHGSNGTTIERDEQAPNNQPTERMCNRGKTCPVGRAILPPLFLNGGMGLW